MSVEFAYRFRPDAPLTDLRDLDVVALTAAVISDTGDEMPIGAEGTIISVHEGGTYVVEFPEPPGAMATVEAQQVRFVERAAL